MAVLEFVDASGVAWTVWSVTPGELSTTFKRLTGTSDERRMPWLVFQSAAGEKRRLAPIPDGWERGDTAVLRQLVARATHVPPAPARRSRDHAARPADDASGRAAG